MALYVFESADWATGEITFSMRHVARLIGVSPTTVRRGVDQLVRLSILALLAKGEGTKRSRYVVVDRPGEAAEGTSEGDLARTPRAHPGHVACPERARSVSGVDTPRVRSAHASCPERARGVSGARTPCDHYSVLFSGISVNTTELSRTADASDGSEPSEPQPDEKAGRRASLFAQTEILTDEENT